MQIQIEDFRPCYQTFGDQVKEINRQLAKMGHAPLVRAEDDPSPVMIGVGYYSISGYPAHATVDLSSMEVLWVS